MADAVAVAVHLQDMDVVGEPVQQRAGEAFRTEQLKTSKRSSPTISRTRRDICRWRFSNRLSFLAPSGRHGDEGLGMRLGAAWSSPPDQLPTSSVTVNADGNLTQCRRRGSREQLLVHSSFAG